MHTYTHICNACGSAVCLPYFSRRDGQIESCCRRSKMGVLRSSVSEDRRTPHQFSIFDPEDRRTPARRSKNPPLNGKGGKQWGTSSVGFLVMSGTRTSFSRQAVRLHCIWNTVINSNISTTAWACLWFWFLLWETGILLSTEEHTGREMMRCAIYHWTVEGLPISSN